MIILSKTTSRSTIESLLVEGTRVEPLYYWLRRHRLNKGQAWDSGSDMIRWGTTASVDVYGHEYNNRESIALACNKKKCREFLYSHDIPVPEPIPVDVHHVFYTDKFPMVVRPEFHQQGKRFEYIQDWYDYVSKLSKIQSWGCDVYGSRYYPKTTEWRVHVGHGKVLTVQQKVQTSESTNRNWNHESGYVFQPVPWKQYRKELVSLAIKTIEVLGLDFGAVDILADPTDTSLPNAVVCEVNTAPKLVGYTAKRYAEYFNWLVDTGERRHFDVPEDTKPRHYVFKHRELSECDYDFGFKDI